MDPVNPEFNHIYMYSHAYHAYSILVLNPGPKP